MGEGKLKIQIYYRGDGQEAEIRTEDECGDPGKRKQGFGEDLRPLKGDPGTLHKHGKGLAYWARAHSLHLICINNM